MTHLTDTIISTIAVCIGVASSTAEEYHGPETTVGGIYDTSYKSVIRTIFAIRRFLPSRIVADTTILNMVIFGNSKRP
jgi:hypothetical protein